ncbi:unnamed protein product [Rotaria socialis]|uniref:Uncharacterized protein n=1 Tax=Rotaria socialis TaxID=392032 RepID=A0A820DA38_9BILA|nr:unnamed protein product [Rotaria socialis]
MVRLSMGSLGAQSSGKTINIMTNDVQTDDHLRLDTHFLWIGTLETIVVLVILWSHVGFTILLATIYTLMVISVQMLWSKGVQQTDLRIKLMTEIVKPIHLVKMHSSLLMTLLGEMKMIGGAMKLNRNARFCYVPQESWIFSDSIKENILFGMEFNEKKFNESIYAAGFDTDIANFQYGDSTLVGDNGIILSGGQKARLSLARALYRDEDIYLLDDPLSAVDVQVARHIFEKCILGRLRSKMCILVTHQIQFLKYATTILFLDKGNQLASGTYSQLHQMCPEFKQWTQTNTNNPRLDSSSASDTASQLNSSPTPEFVTQFSLFAGVPTSPETEKLLVPTTEKSVQKQTEEFKRIGSVSGSVYLRYIQASLWGVLGIAIIFILFMGTSVLTLFTNWWLGRWSNAERIRYASKSTNVNCTIENHSPIRNMTMNAWFKKRDNYFYTLLGFVLLNIILLFLRTILYFLSTHIAARTIHNQMFSSILRAPVYFFDTNPIGRIINRCSKDISSIDEKLSETTYNFIEAFSNIASTISFIAYIQPVSLISLIFVGTILERIRRFFSPAIRDIKRLESLGRSPIYSYICATIQGIPLIRSYGAQTMCTRNFSYYLDEHSRAFSLMLTMNRWLAMRIESVIAAFIGLLTFSMFLVHRNLPVSDLGLILAYSFTLMGSVQWIVRLIVDVMIQMTSTERVIEYIDLKPEESSTSDQLVILPPRWPIGSIVFDNMSFRYSDDSSWVLSNINISIEPGEKIGIVGRTGAGKSSIIQALFRMAELDGRILIDEIDTKQIPLYELRRHISIIPQDPVLFNDSLRINLDPFGEYSDIEIWSALNEVQFKFDLIEGLQHNVTEGGSNFSVGQRQLICLARALLRKNRILLIDEATANVDHKTDEIIQVAIRRKFIHCTVLTIAHRLRTIIDSDKILVLSQGRAVEFASAHELLSDNNSQFAQLVAQTGQREADYLRHQAKKAAKSRK